MNVGPKRSSNDPEKQGLSREAIVRRGSGDESPDIPVPRPPNIPTPPGPVTPFPQTEIDKKYAALGGSGGFLGAPTTNEAPTADGTGRYRHFQNGSIFWHPATGAHEVHGAIRDRWSNLGWERGSLGYPLSDESGTQEAARYSQFQHGFIYWIGQPPVTRRMTPYPSIRFQQGDRVSIEAGGCAQTGGSGNTWKRYVDPVGDDTARLFHGLISIPGLTAGLVRLAGMVGRTVEIPQSINQPQNLYLRLGYEDDNYGDNGYGGHDDGDQDQCKGVGPAWVRLTIERGAPSRLPIVDPHRALDLVWDQLDANDVPCAPRWSSQPNGTAQPPDVQAICPSVPVIGTLITPACTTQAPSFDRPAADQKAFITCGGKGHANWGPATYDGIIHFKDHDGGLTGDDDYNLWLRYKDNSGLTKGSFDSGVFNPVAGAALLLEFDSDETIDNFRSPWWQNFHAAVDNDRGNMIDGARAIATGLFGLDTVHAIWTELHPVWALAMRVKNDPADEVWAIFVRNWGNQGGCSQDQHYLDLPNNTYTFSLPWRYSATSVTAARFSGDFHLSGNGTSGPVVRAVPGQSVQVSFTLPPPEARGFIDGELHLHWEPVAAAADPCQPIINEIANIQSELASLSQNDIPGPGPRRPPIQDPEMTELEAELRQKENELSQCRQQHPAI